MVCHKKSEIWHTYLTVKYQLLMAYQHSCSHCGCSDTKNFWHGIGVKYLQLFGSSMQ